MNNPNVMEQNRHEILTLDRQSLYGGTVLEFIAGQSTVHQAQYPGPPQTPAQPFQTHTRSGEGYAVITDDQDQEYLYE